MFSPFTSVSAHRQAKAEMSISAACRARENSTIASSQSPKLCWHWRRWSTRPLQNTNWGESGRSLEKERKWLNL